MKFTLAARWRIDGWVAMSGLWKLPGGVSWAGEEMAGGEMGKLGDLTWRPASALASLGLQDVWLWGEGRGGLGGVPPPKDNWAFVVLWLLDFWLVYLLLVLALYQPRIWFWWSSWDCNYIPLTQY